MTMPVDVVAELEAALDAAGIPVGGEYGIGPYIEINADNITLTIHAVDDEVAGPARHTDPGTSKKAGKEGVGRFGTLRYNVFVAIAKAGDYGATATELEQTTGIDWRSMTPRVGELKRWGYVTTSGATRKGDRGADQDVCVLTEKGKAEARALNILGSLSGLSNVGA
jgi:hypothetical protein